MNVLVLIAALLPTYLIRFQLAGIPTTLLELIIYGAVIAVLLREGWRPILQRFNQRRVWLLPPVLLAVGGMIGVAVSPDTRAALGLLKGFIFDPILVYLLALAAPVRIERTIQALVGSVALIAGLAIVQVLARDESRALGVYALDAMSSPNYLAFAIAPIVPLVVAATKDRRLQVFGACTLLVALFLTGSRAGFVAGAAGLCVAVLLQSASFWRERWVRLMALVLLVGALAGSWLVVRPDFGASPEDGGRVTSSNNVRWQLWGATGELIRAHPLTGVGLGDFQQAFDALTHDRVNFSAYITPEARTPHNLAIGLWTDTGIFGLAAFFALLVLVGRALVRAARVPVTRFIAAALIGSWSVLLAHGLVDMPIWKNDGMVLFWVLAALPLLLNEQRLKR